MSEPENTPENTPAKTPKKRTSKTDTLSQSMEASNKRIRNLEIKFWILLSIIFVLLIFCFFRQAPVIQGRSQSELTSWTKQQAQTIPSQYRTIIKTILRESYSETAAMIQSRQIATTADARTRLSQILQAKIISKNPQDVKTIVKIMKPISDAIGDRLSSDVESGKMTDSLENVEKIFLEIAAGFK